MFQKRHCRSCHCATICNGRWAVDRAIASVIIGPGISILFAVEKTKIATRNGPLKKTLNKCSVLLLSYIHHSSQLWYPALTGLQVDPDVLHDGDVKLVEDAHDDTLAARGADGVVVRLGVDEKFESVGQTVLCKRNHCPDKEDGSFYK